jgi:protein Hikeshi
MSGPDPLFGIVPAGQPLVTEPTSAPSQTSFLYSIPASRAYSHIVVFLLPGIRLPHNTAAAIYHTTASEVANAEAAGQTPDFRFLGGIGPGKESAIFKVNAANDGGQVIGISLEPADSVASRIQELSIKKTVATPTKVDQPTTLILAQRIIKNAFNFLASFSGTSGPGGIEVVPLKAFEDWWRKFESRVRSDPSFLERQED